MKWLKDFKYKDQCKLGIILISFAAFIVLLFLNSSNIMIGVKKLNSLLAPFIYGFVIAYLLNPAISFFEVNILSGRKMYIKQLKFHRLCSIAFVYFILLTLLLICCMIIIPQLVDSISNIIKVFPDTLNSFNEQLYNLSQTNSYLATAYNKYNFDLSTILENIYSHTSEILSTTYDYAVTTGIFIKDFALGLFISIYMLWYKEEIITGLSKYSKALIKPKVLNTCIHVIKCSDDVFGGFIIASIIDSLIIGILTYICLLIFRVPYAMLLSVLVGVTNIIPVFGPIIGGVIGCLLLVFTNTKAFWVFMILVLVIQQADGNLIKPKVVGIKLGMSALWIIFGVTVVGGMLGIVGLFIGVPVFAVIYILIKEYIQHKVMNTEIKISEEINSEKESNDNE